MNLREVASATGELASHAYDGVRKFAKLERGLAVFCAAAPLLLIGFDAWAVRDSISAYYDMEQAVVFYVPLTVAAMLFVVNGVVKHKHSYNTILGIALFGLVVLNHDDFNLWHNLFALAFFIGNAVVILYSDTKAPVKVVILAVALGLFLIAFAVDGWKLFWLEWASLGVIAVHYVLDSLDRAPYHAPVRRSARTSQAAAG